MRTVLAALLLSLPAPAPALADPPMVIERVVPPGATLTYAVDGVTVHSIKVPEGRIRVTIQLGDSIIPRHSGRNKRGSVQ